MFAAKPRLSWRSRLPMNSARPIAIALDDVTARASDYHPDRGFSDDRGHEVYFYFLRGAPISLTAPHVAAARLFINFARPCRPQVHLDAVKKP